MAAVLIPVYKDEINEAERFAITNNLSVISNRDVYFFGPRDLGPKYLKEFKNNSKNRISYADFDKDNFRSIKTYNSLMVSKSFYKRFDNYDYVMIVQPDALLFKDEIDYWCSLEYSYVGAPFTCLDEINRSAMHIFGGNGGLSLRKTSHCIEILSGLKHIPNTIWEINRSSLLKYCWHHFIFSYNKTPFTPRINEDYFWSVLVAEKFKFFKVAPPEIAALFSIETAPKQIYEIYGRHLPMGCHAWEKYDKNFLLGLLKHSRKN